MDDEELLEVEEPEEAPKRDFTQRSKPPYPTPPDELARIFAKRPTLDDKRIELEAQAQPFAIVTPGHEVEPELVIKKTKAGSWSTTSAIGKVASILDDLDVPFKIGRSEYFTGDQVKAIKGKVEGKQTLQTTDYQLVPGVVKENIWMDFPWEGFRASLRGTEISWRGRLYPYKEFIDMMIGGEDAGNSPSE